MRRRPSRGARRPRPIAERRPAIPARGARAIIGAVEQENPPLRLVLGSVAQDVIAARTEAFLAELKAGREVALACDFPKEATPAG